MTLLSPKTPPDQTTRQAIPARAPSGLATLPVSTAHMAVDTQIAGGGADNA